MIVLVWGGAFNERGSNYIRDLVQAEKALKFLEKCKDEVEPQEKKHLLKTIEIIVSYFTRNKTESY